MAQRYQVDGARDDGGLGCGKAMTDAGQLLLLDHDGGSFTATDLRASVDRLQALPRGGLAMLFTDKSLLSVSRFVALLAARVAVLPLDRQTRPETAADLIARYRPELVLLPDLGSPIAALLSGYDCQEDGWCVARDPAPPVHPELGVLLSTSGSTGSAKLVRLSHSNITSNAAAIAQSLSLRPEDRGVTSLPLHYSFGMSLVTSHLSVGSSVLVTPHSVLERRFWADMATFGVTHLAGVPQTYAMLDRIGLAEMDLPACRALLQAGGRLHPRYIQRFDEAARARGREFFVMYGQTEAAPRMACLPPERLPEKLGSVGVAIPGGRFEIRDGAGNLLPVGQIGEIVYRGPNVMMGYANSRADLALADLMGSVLPTGDLGHLDEEGFLYLTGRTKRIAKVAGARISLDEVEYMLSALDPVAVIAHPDDDGIAVFTTVAGDTSATRRKLASDLGVPSRAVTIAHVDRLPELANGKIDYPSLAPLIGARG
jgi:acyl-CoA synthetase (AMP-forming)/AMP-acid ligase II